MWTRRSLGESQAASGTVAAGGAYGQEEGSYPADLRRWYGNRGVWHHLYAISVQGDARRDCGDAAGCASNGGCDCAQGISCAANAADGW